MWLAGACVWSLASLLVATLASIIHRGGGYYTSANVLRTYGNQTFFQHNRAFTVTMVFVFTAALAVAAASLARRQRRSMRAWGATPVIVGSAMIVMGLFGFVFGALSLGVVGGMIILSARPIADLPTPT
jgi:hypothetical protein